MLDDGLNLLVHLGDYIYEPASCADEVRRHEGPEPMTLEEYRARHALSKLDPDLQRVRGLPVGGHLERPGLRVAGIPSHVPGHLDAGSTHASHILAPS
jgi:PhoD-like phosphatase